VAGPCVKAVILWAALGLPGLALAATTAVMQVSASIEAGCLIVGGSTQFGTLEFGSVPAVASQKISARSTNAVQLQCTPGVALSMTVDGGQHPDNGRHLQLEGSSVRVAYELFNDVGLTQALGVGQRVAVGTVDDGIAEVPIYGQVRVSGDVPAGRYRDVVQVELSW